MTISGGSEVICVYEVASDSSPESDSSHREFRGVAACCGAFWAYGDGVLLLSFDGVHWRDLTGELDILEPFSVSAVVGDENGAFIFARNKNGLNCYHLARDTWKCSQLPSLPTPSPGALAVRIGAALVACVKQDARIRFMQFRDADRAWKLLPASLDGVAVHFELSASGCGVCALWGIEREDGVALPSPSAVYRTQDGGISWIKVQEIDTMLLGGAAGDGGVTLLGGTDGYLAVETVAGFQNCNQPSTDEIAGVASGRAQQAAVLASLERAPSQTLLWRSSSPEWRRFELGAMERIVAIGFVRFGFVVLCTRRSLFSYGIELVQ